MACMMFLLFASACTKDIDGLDGTGNSVKGSWTRQIQWAETNGTREDTYTFKSGGKGTYKHWDWFDQKYRNNSLTWTGAGDMIIINIEADANASYSERYGILNSSGTSMKIGDYWYDKK